MLLALDIGNTDVTVGAFERAELVGEWRLRSDVGRTSDEYGTLMRGMLRSAGREPADVASVWGASVVPALNARFSAVSQRYFGCEMRWVNYETDTGVRLDVDLPSQVGADRIVNAVAASALHGTPAVVIDFGTATTFDVVLEGPSYIGGAILPGIQISMAALYERAAQLSAVELSKPRRAIGRNTADCIRSGFYYGFLGQVERVLTETVAEIPGEPTVIATGGLSRWIAPDLTSIDVVDDRLTLNGIRIVADRGTE